VVYSPELGVQGVVCAPALKVQDVLRQLVPVAWLCVAGCSWPWRKGPAILRAPGVLQYCSKGEAGAAEERVIFCGGESVVHVAPSPQSCCP
jgi:hypothetical protein